MRASPRERRRDTIVYVATAAGSRGAATRPRRLFACVIPIATLLACYGCDNASATDAAPPEDCARSYYEQDLGYIPNDGGCAGCGFGAEGDPACAAAYPVVPPDCVAVCKDSMCEAYCQGQGCLFPEAGPCEPGEQACTRPSGDYAILYICDPVCADAGGCRGCYFDSHCREELGPTGICERHCGTCCRVEDNYDGPFPCLCE